MTPTGQPSVPPNPITSPPNLEQALLQAARHSPEEDTPRLALADWLQDRVQPQRAEFVRLQCRLAPGSPPLASEAWQAMTTRCEELLDLHGGAWLGPLWRWGPELLAWHRGLLAVRVSRRFQPEPLLEMATWLDTLLFEVGGRRSLERALAVVAQTEVNHLCLDLRTPLSEDTLLQELDGLPVSPCLRTLTFSWPLRLLSHHQAEGSETATPTPAVSQGFLERLLSGCPMGRHLSHLGSDFPFSDEQAALIRSLGVQPAHADRRWWMHRLDPRLLRRGGSLQG